MMPRGPRRATGKRPERELSAAIIRLLQAHGIMAWRTGGGAFRIDGRFVRMGTKGMSDVIGIVPRGVNGNMALVGQFLAIEVKNPGGKVSPEQAAFLDTVNKAGGIGFVARSCQDVIDKLQLGAPAGAGRVDELIHVLPIDDSAQHRDSMDCWCVPTPDEQESLVIVHHSADGRELTENV